MTSQQYWTNQFNKYGEPYYRWQFNKLTLEEFLSMPKKERKELIKYLKKPSLLKRITENLDILIDN